MKVGDRVKGVGYFKGFTASVTEVKPGPSKEDPGVITVFVGSIDVGKGLNKFHLRVGTVDCFHYYEWWKYLEVLPEGES